MKYRDISKILKYCPALPMALAALNFSSIQPFSGKNDH